MPAARSTLLLVTLLAAAAPPARTFAFELAYEHDLTTPVGKIRTSSVWLSYDAHAREVLVIGYGLVRVFNPVGMEVFRFGEDAESGSIRGAVALESGDMVLLALKHGKTSLLRANFRGEVTGRIALTGLPERFRDFGANRLLYADRKLFLVDETGMELVVTTEAGVHLASYDLAELTGWADERQSLGVSGCGVDRSGRFLFTLASKFRVLVLAPDGTLSGFGRGGGAPGLFNVISGVGADDEGRIYVADSLKSAVIVFDSRFKFLGEFGYQGLGPGKLLHPTSLVVGGDKVYVSQGGARGVSVFRIVLDAPRATRRAATGG